MGSILSRPTRRELLVYGTATLAAGGRVSLPSGPGYRAVQFMVLGDWGRDGAYHQRAVAAAMGEFRTSKFVLTTGDNFYQHGVGSVRDRLWDSSFQQIYTELPQRWYASLGNHDYRGRVEAQIERSFNDPRWRMPNYWYDLRLDAYGRPDIHLFVINTVVWQGREKFPYNWRGSSVSRKQQRRQREWLEARLASSDASLKLVIGHHPIYSVRRQGSYYGMPDLDALLFDHGVTAYFSGHDHCMYHISAPDWRGKVAGRMHYICSGAGSQMRPVYPACVPHGLASQSGCVEREQLGRNQPFWHAFFTESQTAASVDLKGGFAVIEIQESNIHLRFIEPVADVAAGRAWRERYSFNMPFRATPRRVFSVPIDHGAPVPAHEELALGNPRVLF